MKDGSLLSDFQRDNWPGSDEIVSCTFLRDSNETLAVHAEKLISSLKTTVGVSGAATDNRLDVDAKAILEREND
jgi:hypothetical protein